ncbi:hypothetical protein I553_1970 [Mycobacterium xenopi 4042]|uniref:Uncharacterized protein n=1 Tax=Mycobacterium xenopi 4042 TaxID=1299334 RepID=X8DJK9_MYCXE|nr:hypothetical protein I553_1970 [Mycobacterium xenopi 4042]
MAATRPGEYSLIVDADTEKPVDPEATDPVTMVPTRALLHRPAAGDSRPVRAGTPTTA